MAFVKGISFPFRKGATSFPQTVTDNELVQQSILQILGTVKGTRLMRPQYGANLWAFLFEPNDAVLAAAIREEVLTAIATFEPRAVLQDVTVARADSTVTVTIKYVVVLTQQVQQLAIDFPNPLGGA